MDTRTEGAVTRRVHVYWNGMGERPSPQAVSGAARREAGEPVRLIGEFADGIGNGVTYVFRIEKRLED